MERYEWGSGAHEAHLLWGERVIQELTQTDTGSFLTQLFICLERVECIAFFPRPVMRNARDWRSPMQPEFSTISAITLAIAVLGAVLGVINTWKSIDRDKVKLRVVPKHAIPVGMPDDRDRLCIDVTNLSTFPVTISEVGILFKGTEEKGALIQPIIYDGGPFPRRLDARSSFTVYFSPEATLKEAFRVTRCAYARTDCGVQATGTSGALKQMVRDARKAHRP